eukprot:70188_1
MSSTRKLLLRITKYTVHTHSCANINRGMVTKWIEIEHCKVHSSFACPIRKIHSDLHQDHAHSITSILSGCRSFKDCYRVIRSKEEYLVLLNKDDSSYTYQHHKYFILHLIERASKDQYLSWQMIWNLIQFYSNFKARYHVPTESIYTFLSILSRRGDFTAVSCIIERLLDIETLPINHRVFCLLMEALRVGGQSHKGYGLLEQALSDFNLEPSVTLLLHGYMCNPSKWNFNLISLLNEYDLECGASAYSEVIQFHLKCIMQQSQVRKKKKMYNAQFDDLVSIADKLPSDINITIDVVEPNSKPTELSFKTLQLHGQRVLFYLNHAHSSNCHLKSEIFDDIILTCFNHMFGTKLCCNEWMAQYVQHIVFEQLRNHTPQHLSSILPLVFEGCLNRNQIELSRDIWRNAETLNIEIDATSHKHYNDLCIRHFVRHDAQRLTVFAGDACSSQETLSRLPQAEEECFKLAKNLLHRSDGIASLIDGVAAAAEARSCKAFLTDMEHGITFCRKYNDIVSGRMLYEAFINSKLSFKLYAAMATDFLFLLDYTAHDEYRMSPQDVMTLWPLHPPQAFINKAFTVLITCKHAEGMKKLLDTVAIHHAKLSLTPKMMMLASDVFAHETLTDTVYWDYLWRLMEDKRFKSARTKPSVAYIGNKILTKMKEQKKDEDAMMEEVKRIHNTFKHYALPLPLPLMQKLHANLSNAMHKSWIRHIFVEEHQHNMMNDYRWYIDSELFHKSLEEGLYHHLKPLRKLMIDGSIPVSHTLVHRILLTFSNSSNLYLPDLKQFIIECQAHYKHAFSPKEKSLIRAMIKRHAPGNTDQDVASIKEYLKIPHTAKTPTIKMSDSMRFQVGETVQLCGLTQHAYLSGAMATVVGFFNRETHSYPLQLKDNPHVVHVSASNMRFAKHMIHHTLPPVSSSSSAIDINEQILQHRIKEILKHHPIGLDIVSLLRQYQLMFNAPMFAEEEEEEYQILTERLRAMNFIVSVTSASPAAAAGYIVFDSYC